MKFNKKLFLDHPFVSWWGWAIGHEGGQNEEDFRYEGFSVFNLMREHMVHCTVLNRTVQYSSVHWYKFLGKK